MSNIGSVNFTYGGTANLSTFNAAFVRVTGFTQLAYVNALNYAYLTASNTQAYYLYDSAPPSADYSVSVDGILNSVIASNEVAALARASTTESTFYKLGLTSAGVLTLTRRLAGTNSVIGSDTVTVAAGNTYNVKIVCDGDQISGYVNDVLVIEPITNSDITAAGRPGLALISGGGTGPTMSTGWALDNLSWDTIESGATDATTTGGTGTSPGSGSGGAATGSSGGTDATTTGGTGASTGSGSGGSATGAASATITLRAIDFTTSELRVSETGVEAIINELTGALVLRQTGLSIDASGNCPVTNVAFTSGTTYRCTTIHSDGSEGTWRYTAV